MGLQVDVFLPVDDQYYPGTTAAYDQSTGIQKLSYDDEDKEEINMENETWINLQSSAAVDKERTAPRNVSSYDNDSRHNLSVENLGLSN